MKKALALSILLLTLAAPVWAQSASTEGPLSARVELEPEHVRLGAELRYRVHITSPKGYEVYVPTTPELEPFRLVAPPRPTEAPSEAPAPRAVEVTRTEQGDELHTEALFHLRPYRLGLRKIPAIEIPYLAPDGETGILTLPERRLRVLSRLTTEDAPELAVPGAPVPVMSRNWALIIILVVLGAMLLSALIAWIVVWWLRRRPNVAAPPPPPRPAHLIALEKLSLVEARGYLERDEKMPFYVEVSEAVREYFGNRYGFDGLPMTSLELLRALQGADLRAVPESQVRSFLDESDLVKFAGFAPTDDEARWLLETAYEIVRGTLPPEEAPVASPEGPDEAGEEATP